MKIIINLLISVCIVTGCKKEEIAHLPLNSTEQRIRGDWKAQNGLVIDTLSNDTVWNPSYIVEFTDVDYILTEIPDDKAMTFNSQGFNSWKYDENDSVLYLSADQWKISTLNEFEMIVYYSFNPESVIKYSK